METELPDMNRIGFQCILHIKTDGAKDFRLFAVCLMERLMGHLPGHVKLEMRQYWLAMVSASQARPFVSASWICIQSGARLLFK